MKKIIPLVFIVTLLSTGAVMAKSETVNTGGFNDDLTTEVHPEGNPEGLPEGCPEGRPDDRQGAKMHNRDHKRDHMPERGGFKGEPLPVSKIEEAKKMKDDQKVVLRGYIVKSLADENYMFKDDSDTIEIKIDDKRWRGVVVTTKDLIEIRGVVDKDWDSTKIDVGHIIKVKQK